MHFVGLFLSSFWYDLAAINSFRFMRLYFTQQVYDDRHLQNKPLVTATIQTYLFSHTLLQKLCHTFQNFYLIKYFSICVKYQASSTLKVRSRLAESKLTVKELLKILILSVVPLSITVHFALNIFRKLSSRYLTIIALILRPKFCQRLTSFAWVTWTVNAGINKSI